MKIKKNYFNLFANVILTRGYSKSTICDLHRGVVYNIPSSMADFIQSINNNLFIEVYNQYSGEDKLIIEEYIEYLGLHELAFWTNTPDHYPAIDLVWKSPEHINNAIIELEDFSDKTISKICSELGLLLCKHVEIRQYSSLNINALKSFTREIKKTSVRSVVVYAPFDTSVPLSIMEELVQGNPRIVLFVCHSCSPQSVSSPSKVKRLKFLQKKISSNLHCGQIDPKLFSIKIKTYTEAHHHNSCLNKKICIDRNGEIKNCPSMPESFGNVKNTTLREALEKPGFKKYWNIQKDEISVCKDCEFRYVCTDCRAYVEDPDDIYSKPLKCGYNPYTGEWSEWSTNPLKAKAINYYGLEELLAGEPPGA